MHIVTVKYYLSILLEFENIFYCILKVCQKDMRFETEERFENLKKKKKKLQ